MADRRPQSKKHRRSGSKMSRDQLLWIQDLRRSNSSQPIPGGKDRSQKHRKRRFDMEE